VVPTGEVIAAVEHCFNTYDVVRMYADPSWWPTQLDQWAERYGQDRVLRFPNTPTRMVPACASFYGAVMDRSFTHDGDKLLMRHVSNATLKQSPNGAGAFISKMKSRLKIDAAVAAVMCWQALLDVKSQGSVEVTVMYV
jgi:phage terminase large subunit-like protein